MQSVTILPGRDKTGKPEPFQGITLERGGPLTGLDCGWLTGTGLTFAKLPPPFCLDLC